jgi:hypothetical protein
VRRFTALYAFGLSVVLLPGCSNSSGPPAADPKAASASQPSAEEVLKWSRPIAEEFLRAVMSGNFDAAVGAVSSGFEARLRDLSESATVPVSSAATLTRVLRVEGVTMVYGAKSNVASWEIRSESVAPDRREAAFDGVFRTDAGAEYSFRVRVIPDGEAGRWRVDSVVLSK